MNFFWFLKTPISIQIKSKSDLIHFFPFFLPGKPELCGSNNLLHSCQSCFSFFVRLHGQTELFGSCIIHQSCSSLFFHLHAQPSDNLTFLSKSFSSPSILHSFLCSPVSEVLFAALSPSERFCSSGFFFVHAKAALG